jgi:hypothetical protein
MFIFFVSIAKVQKTYLVLYLNRFEGAKGLLKMPIYINLYIIFSCPDSELLIFFVYFA